jgi:pyruvate ferredoxin oxidoreductase beta subunit
VEVGKLAVRTGVWPLKEYVDGEVTHTKIPYPREPVVRYLECQDRFAHLFDPVRDDATLADIQAHVDAYWRSIESRDRR